jgi:peptide deformylase
MEFPFLKPNDPRLKQIAQPVPVDAITSPQTKHIVDTLFGIAYPNQTDRSRPLLMGIAASQVGIPRRVMIIDTAADGHGRVGNLEAFINPVITAASPELAEWYEGCYSTAPACGVVARPTAITVEAYAPDGRPITKQLEGYIARIFQHEIDHLDGRLFIDRISDDAKLHWVESHEYPEYRDQEGWRTWSKLFPRDRWNQTPTKT